MQNLNYKQTTYESCLSVALMQLLGIKPSRSKEINIWKSGWDFNFLIGQVNYVSNKYDKKITICVENPLYLNDLKKQNSSYVSLIHKRIDSKLINSLLRYGKFIIYLDNYYIQKVTHAPHFILIQKENKNDYLISDPWDGKQKLINKKTIHKAVSSLRNHLKFSPIIIFEYC